MSSNSKPNSHPATNSKAHSKADELIDHNQFGVAIQRGNTNGSNEVDDPSSTENGNDRNNNHGGTYSSDHAHDINGVETSSYTNRETYDVPVPPPNYPFNDHSPQTYSSKHTRSTNDGEGSSYTDREGHRIPVLSPSYLSKAQAFDRMNIMSEIDPDYKFKELFKRDIKSQISFAFEDFVFKKDNLFWQSAALQIGLNVFMGIKEYFLNPDTFVLTPETDIPALCLFPHPATPKYSFMYLELVDTLLTDKMLSYGSLAEKFTKPAGLIRMKDIIQYIDRCKYQQRLNQRYPLMDRINVLSGEYMKWSSDPDGYVFIRPGAVAQALAADPQVSRASNGTFKTGVRRPANDQSNEVDTLPKAETDQIAITNNGNGNANDSKKKSKKKGDRVEKKKKKSSRKRKLIEFQTGDGMQQSVPNQTEFRGHAQGEL
ncbi:uncharacterized protein J8A68_001867 [[Candida] subhashii]|uniref:Uncharacterized protein n=1 Tax=[Candida] subhashii TaxID=561895 RepID=A0A8J5QM08_9ASCO|nr:uncharacterized protein J8A68_001867 [[Candida] subhashii]KAG7664573.1 hypothetical protein J8A68_001867 [[Candida] subhashii]